LDLTALVLQANQLTDTAGLVAITGIGNGDVMDITSNPFEADCAAHSADLAALRDRGVNLLTNCP
jgi:hypothetical protein